VARLEDEGVSRTGLTIQTENVAGIEVAAPHCVPTNGEHDSSSDEGGSITAGDASALWDASRVFRP
jgi:hypothetical protein